MKAEVFLKTSRRKHIQKLKILEHFDNSNGAEPNLENQNDDTENQPIRNGDTSNPPISFEGPVRGKIEKTGVKRKCLNGESSQAKSLKLEESQVCRDSQGNSTVLLSNGKVADNKKDSPERLPQISNGNLHDCDSPHSSNDNHCSSHSSRDGCDTDENENSVVSHHSVIVRPETSMFPSVSFHEHLGYHGNPGYHGIIPNHLSAFKTVKGASRLPLTIFTTHIPTSADILHSSAVPSVPAPTVVCSPSPSIGLASYTLIDSSINSNSHSPPGILAGQVMNAAEESIQRHSPSSHMQTTKSYTMNVLSRDKSLSPSHLEAGILAGVEPLHCRWMNCDRTFFHMDDLVNHVNDQHVKVERPDVDYQCKWERCPRKGKGFNARYKMLIHIRTHTNEKPHQCNLCGKCFSRLENLKIHNRSHTGEKPYICPFEGCNKAYSNSSDRFKHVRTHQEEKPYICKMPGCNKRYTDPSSLRKHVRTHGHYFRSESDPSNNSSKSSSVSQILPIGHMMQSAPSQHSAPIISSASSGSTRVFRLSPNHMMGPQAVGPLPLHHLQGPSISSNPLLSSTLLCTSSSKQAIATQSEVVGMSPTSLKLEIQQDKLSSDHDEKSQDGPLDLTTSPPVGRLEEEEQNHINFASKWVL